MADAPSESVWVNIHPLSADSGKRVVIAVQLVGGYPYQLMVIEQGRVSITYHSMVRFDPIVIENSLVSS